MGKPPPNLYHFTAVQACCLAEVSPVPIVLEFHQAVCRTAGLMQFCQNIYCGMVWWSSVLMRGLSADSGGVVLDLMSSWVSHLPPEVKYEKVRH